MESIMNKFIRLSLRAAKGAWPRQGGASPRKELFAMILCWILSLFLTTGCFAATDILIVKSPLVWRGDGQGDYLFKQNGSFSGTAIGADGCVEYLSEGGIYDLKVPYSADSLIKSITVNWIFTGKVTMEVSATGESRDYVPVINGVPLKKGFKEGSSLKWRAALEPGSKLIEVKVNYEDILGSESSWGNPDLSGFKFRKPVYVKGSADRELFNYPVLIKIGESVKSENSDFYLKGVIQSGFSDIRWAQADEETSLSYWVESISGEAHNRTASVWVNIPQIPSSGLKICLYYGKDNSRDLSDGEKAFDFFDDFKEGVLNAEKWRDYGFNVRDAMVEYKAASDGQVRTADITGLTIDAVIRLFQDTTAYEWVRVRKTAVMPAAIDVDNTKAAAEELPNLADFQGVKTALNGDLVLDDDLVSGAYVSVGYFPSFEARIMIPSWQSLTFLGNSAAVDISADNSYFRKDCNNEDYYYAGRKDFVKGGKIKWHIRLNRNSKEALSARMQYFSLDYRPGKITLVAPDGGENLIPGNDYKIVWSAWEYEPSYRMMLEYSSDGGATYNLIHKAVDNTGAYIWRVPVISSDKVLIRISDALDSTVFDISGKYFSIGRGKTKTSTSKGRISSSRGRAGLTSRTTGKLDEVVLDNQQATEQPESAAEAEVLTTNQVKVVELDKVVSHKKQSGAALYDLVFKVDDPVNLAEGAIGIYDGELLAVMPAGNLWSETEKNSLLILPVYLTEEKIEEFNKQEEISTGQKDDLGNPVIVMVEKRYKIDFEKLGLISSKLKKIEKGKKNIRDINAKLKEKYEGRDTIK